MAWDRLAHGHQPLQILSSFRFYPLFKKRTWNSRTGIPFEIPCIRKDFESTSK